VDGTISVSSRSAFAAPFLGGAIMATLSFSLAGVAPQTNFGLLPEGDYSCVIRDVREVKSRSGNLQLAVRFEVTTKGHERRVLTAWHMTTNQVGLGHIAGLVAAASISPDEFTKNSDVAIGRPIGVKVVHKRDNGGEMRARVDGYFTVAATQPQEAAEATEDGEWDEEVPF
jgi:hypothetical protein